ncbi:Ig-like domain-containing protein [Vibrio barjaei]|uniref:Ig-like domain-containing protein n=1 Tax=Vibrio barjaei TaxID=1676683 RepID=UPI002284C00E|nr:Ig-like domain-containing protein [Vibrio barjaei]MCY9871637.1 Ig-like domain-containing protein [Vibrio barjaei]
MQMTKTLYRLCVLWMTFFLAACNGDNSGFPTSECGGPDNPCAPYITSIAVVPPVKAIANGTQFQFQAIANYSDGSVQDISALSQWSIIDSSIATIVSDGTQGGLVDGKQIGITTVNAQYQTYQASSELTVTSAVLDSLSISPVNKTVPAGVAVQYQAMALFSDASQQDVTKFGNWQSGTANVATIGSKSGNAATLSQGTTQISFSYQGKSVQTDLNVTNAVISSLQVTPKNLAKPVGTTGKYTATAYYSDGHSEDVTQLATWNSSNGRAVSIVMDGTDGGLATAKEIGTTQITASYQGIASFSKMRNTISDSTAATVTQVSVTDLVVTPAKASVAAGNIQQYQAFALFSDGTSREVTDLASWQSSNNSVASINQKGLADSYQSGDVVVTATYASQQADALLNVTQAQLTELVVSPNKVTIPAGHQTKLQAVAVYSDGSSNDVTLQSVWTSMDQSVVQVETGNISAGTVHGLVLGQADVTAKFGGMEQSSMITVSSATLTSVSISPANATIPKGTTQSYVLTAQYSDGSKRDVSTLSSWQSNNTDIATINAFGVAYGEQQGASQTSGCYLGECDTANLSVTQAVVTGLQVTPASATIADGQSQYYQATAFYSDGTSKVVTQIATWTSSDINIATISSTGTAGGKATGVEPGSVVISARYAGQQSQATLTVTAATAVKLIVSPAITKVPAGLSLPYHADALYTDGTLQDVTLLSVWQSSDSDVASIDTSANATTFVAGQTTISAQYLGLNGEASLTVTAAVLDHLEVTPNAVTVPTGTNGQFEATAIYSDGSSVDVTSSANWSSSDSIVVNVDNSLANAGVGSALSVGSAVVTATYSGMSDTSSVTVIAPSLVELTISPQNKTVPLGLELQYEAHARYSDGTSRTVTLESSWQSSMTTVATISTDGLASTVYTGETQISATFESITASTSLIVTEPILMELQVTPAIATINIQDLQQYKATAVFSDKTVTDVTTGATWTIADDVIAHVDNARFREGLVTGLSSGQTSVIATYYGKTANAEVVVGNLTYLGVNVEPADSMVKVGDTKQLTAYAIYKDVDTNKISYKDVTTLSDWRVENRDKLAVNTTGLIEGKSAGGSLVYAIYQSIEGAGQVTVVDTYVRQLVVTPDNETVPEGTVGRYKAIAKYHQGLPDEDVTSKATWSSSDPNVIQVVTTGELGGSGEALSAGSAQIKAEFDGAKDEVTTTVAPLVLAQVAIEPRQDILYSGTPFQYHAIAYYQGGANKDVTLDAEWSSSDTTAATIESGNAKAGLAQGVYEGGRATITMSYQGMTDFVETQTYPATTTKVEIVPQNITVASGDTVEVTVNVTFSDGRVENYAKYVSWSSSDMNVAYPSKQYVSGISAGTATITASFENVTGDALVTVTP